MRILLLNPPFRFKMSRGSRWPELTKSGTLYYPFWLAHATGVLMKTDHKPLLIDAVARGWGVSKTIDEIVKFNPNMVVIETTTPSIAYDLKFVEELKKNLDAKIVLVGTHVSALPQETLKMSDSVDFIARKEYDYTIPELVDYLENGKDLTEVLGISYRKNKKIIHNKDRQFIKDLDALPFVSKVYKKFLNVGDYRYALAKHPMIQIWSSRGCPNMCTFCQFPQTLSGRIFRTRSPENFVDELEWIKENLPQIKEVFIEDDTFSVDKKRVMKICELIKERNLDLVWSCNARADIPFDVLKNMKEAGCRMLIIGYESGNDEILRNIKKGMTTKQAKKFTKDAKKLGLKIFGCFMIGLPGDTKETIEQTFQFARELNPDMVFFQQAVPFPGTEFYEWCKRNDYLVAKNWDDWLDKNGQLASIVNYPNLTNEEIKRLRDELMIRFYSSPKWMIQSLLHNMNLDEIVRLANAAKGYLSYLLKRNKI